MKLCELYVKFKEFVKTFNTVENTSMSTTPSQKALYIFDYPYTFSSSVEAALRIHNSGEYEKLINIRPLRFQNEMEKYSEQNEERLARIIQRQRLEIMMSSAIDQDTYAAIDTSDYIKIYRSTDGTAVVVSDMNYEEISIIMVPNNLPDIISHKTYGKHDGYWRLFLNQNNTLDQNIQTRHESYDMGAVSGNSIVSEIQSIEKQYGDGDKVIAFGLG